MTTWTDDEVGGSVWSEDEAAGTALGAATGSSLVGHISSGSGAVPDTVAGQLKQWVNIRQFMTAAQRADVEAGAKLVDCQSAVQAAVDHCLLNNFDLYNPYKYVLLSSTVNIDRQVDGAAYDSFFTIHGGGFYVKTAINLFSSSIAFTTAPVSQLVRFNGVNFEASDATLAAYVLQGGRFLRTQFDACNFVKIKCQTSTIYTQSIYFKGCNARRGNGTFYTSTATSFDVKWEGIAESWTGDFFNLAKAVGCEIRGCLEGISGTPVVYNGAQGLDICAYFEENGLDIDGTGANVAYGVFIHGSNFVQGNTATYSVIWGAGGQFGCASIGNYHNGSMHKILASSSVDLTIRDIAAVSLSDRNHENCTSWGVDAMSANTTGANAAFGKNALKAVTTGSLNSAFGNGALQAVTGGENTAIGQGALNASTADSLNTACGRAALLTLNGGSTNTALGAYAGISLTTGGSNTLLGETAGDNLTTGSNNTVIGRGADASAVGVSNEVTLGNASITVVRTAGGVAPGTDAGAFQTARLFAGAGAPNNANGADGDFYFRSDGTKAGNTAIYHKEAAAWVALVTA